LVSLFLAAFDKTLLIPAVGIGGVAIYFAAKSLFGKRRAGLIESLAHKSGFTFRREGSTEDEELLARSCLGIGRYNHTNNVMEPPSPDDMRMRVLDYAYSFKTGNYLDTATQTVVHVQSPRLRLPSFLLRPESSLAKLGQLMGAEDINFADAPQFNRMFLLRGENEAVMHILFAPAVIAYCEQLHGISIGGAGDAFVVYRDRQLAAVNDLPERLAEAKALALRFVAASSQMTPLSA